MKNKQKYLDYINNSSEWKQKRLETFKLKGNECLRCSSKKRLNVHHATYTRLYEEDVETDLYILCENCHIEYHKRTRKISIQSTLAFIDGNIFHEKGKRKNKIIGVKSYAVKKEITPEQKQERLLRIQHKVFLQRKRKEDLKKARQERQIKKIEKSKLRKSKSPFDKRKEILEKRLSTIRQFGFKFSDEDKRAMVAHGIKF